MKLLLRCTLVLFIHPSTQQMKKNIYKIHRTTSLIIAIPVILWAASGFMHPIMTTIRPKVATQFLVPTPIDSNKILIPLETALLQNKIDSFSNFRFIHIDTNYFYQIQKINSAIPIYLSTKTGKLLPNGDWLYAQYIAKQFLEGQSNKKNTTPETFTSVISAADCCDAATTCVLKNTKGTKVLNTTLITDFNNEYKSINRLLLVYKVDFARADSIRIYVETTQDRFSFAMDKNRAVFDTIFRLLHTWGWLDFLGKGRVIIEFILVGLAFITSVLGIYIFFTTKSKKVESNIRIKARRNHRFTAISISLFTLMFTFSGAYHAFNKMVIAPEKDQSAHAIFYTNALQLNFSELSNIVHQPITNIDLVSINHQNYWQVNTQKSFKKDDKKTSGTDLMKNKTVAPPSAIYIQTSNNKILPKGEEVYASYLASQFSKQLQSNIKSVVPITKFEGEYGFVNKRLPVFKVSYATNYNERYYVETATGKLSTTINDVDVLEGYSFSLLHKHEFLAWAGKPVKDFSTMFWAMSQIAMVLIGLTLYFKLLNKNRKI
jgi:hypothetical protein